MLRDQRGKDSRSRAVWAALVLVIALAISDAVLTPPLAPKQPDFIDTILASRAVVAAIRISIVFAALFLALSVIALIDRRQWLTRVGPVEVSGEVSDLDTENRRLEAEVEEANRAIKDLEQKLRMHIS